MTNFINRSQKAIDTLEEEIKALEQHNQEEDVVEDVVQEQASKEVETKEVLTAEEESFKKRYGDLRRHSQKKENELLKRIEQLEAQSKGQPVVVPKTEEEVKAWMDKYPDVAGIVLSLVQTQSPINKLDERLRQIEEKEIELNKKQALSLLKEYHPDLDELQAPNSKLHEWATEQPGWVQDILYDGDDVKAVARVIDMYKIDYDIKPVKKKSDTQKAASAVGGPSRAAPRETGQGRTFKESDIAKMSAKEYADNEEAIMEAHRAGRIIRDVKGAAY